MLGVVGLAAAAAVTVPAGPARAASACDVDSPTSPRSTGHSATVPTTDAGDTGSRRSHPGANPSPTDGRVTDGACPHPGQPPAVLAEPTTIVVPEGGSAAFRVWLSHPPAQSVTLHMGVQGTGVWAGPPMLLVFTPTNWSIPQGYGVLSAPDDDDVDDVAVFTLSVPGYTPATVTFTQLDDDRVR
ncbi:hypothetical protein EF879_11925 [Micromonospora sp. HM5-17]|nr:hypothetical protein EF879_11925 [Micromonospora sp. HM5-17]